MKFGVPLYIYILPIFTSSYKHFKISHKVNIEKIFINRPIGHNTIDTENGVLENRNSNVVYVEKGDKYLMLV